jgi:hypothetical protein
MPTNTDTDANTAADGDGHGRSEDGRDENGRGGDDPNGDRRPSLAELIRDADERGEGNDALVERVGASYDREIPHRRVRRLVDTERERLAREETGTSVEGHAPRYVDCEDLSRLTDGELGRVVAYLLAELDGRAEVTTEGSAIDEPGKPDNAGRTDGRAETTTSERNRMDGANGVEESDDTSGDDSDDEGDANDEAGGGSEAGDGEGVEVRWHRDNGTILVRAIAAEPSRVVDGGTVRRAREHGRSERTGDTNGERDGPEIVDTAIVTVADVVTDATRLADRSGVVLYDRATVRRWLDEAKIPVERLGSLIEEA